MNPFLLTTAYFPPIAYFSCLKKAEVTYIEQYENFGKQSYRNRCEILKRDIRLTTDYIAIGDINYRDLRNAIHPKASHRQPGCDYIPKPYRQTFSDRFPFTPNLSILDLLFCCGPEAGEMI